MSQRNKQSASNWSAYERGRTSSVGSLSSIAEREGQHQPQDGASTTPVSRWFRGSDQHEDGEHTLRTRRSSAWLGSLRQAGGINNIDNFARSFQRAAGFREITPIRRGSITHMDNGDGLDTNPTPGPTPPNKSLLRQQFEAAQHTSPEIAVTDPPSNQDPPESSETTHLLPRQSHEAGNGSFSTRSRYGTDSLAAEFGTSFGSISQRLTNVARRRASILIQQHIEASLKAREDAQDGEDEYKDDILSRPVEVETREDGEIIERHVGESTVPMTIFNSVNVLIGIGILALPLAIKYSGWVMGMLLLLLLAMLTRYTAMLLAKCLDTNSGSTTYGDLAFLAYGDVGRGIVEALFLLELLSGNVAMLILFGDTMHSLLPSLDTLAWKAVLAIGLLPLNVVPFRYLSVTSILGIACTVGIVLIVIVDGIAKAHSPGSLREVMQTHAFPENFLTVPLSIGLFVAPWGGHSVFPAVYKDMRHPQKYGKALRSTYLFTYGLDLTMAVVGYLMFGDFVREEVSSNILLSDKYPKVLSVIMVILVAIIPITKLPLANRPIMDTINKKLLIDVRSMDSKARMYSEKSWKHRSARTAVGVACNVISLGVSVLIPDFDSIMATAGSSLCLTICAILPIAFYLKIFSSDGKVISKSERVMDWILIVICAIFAIIGTSFAVIPKEKLGVKP